MERCHYDPASGQLLSASLMDDALPRAWSMPAIDTALSEVPSPEWPIGIRAGGEGRTTPALAVIANAVVDALRPYSLRHIEMPMTAERVWRTIRSSAS